MNAWTAAWSRPERPNAFRNVLRGLFVDAAPYGSIALDLLVSAKPHAPLRTQPEWLLQARERVIEESSPMMINEIAVEAGVHRVHLARMFVASFGAPPSVIRRRAMLARAVTAIVTGKTSLANAAAASGFSDHAHMARTFREFLGVSPSTLRDVFR
jgi:AraC family transcriptional regulator